MDEHHLELTVCGQLTDVRLDTLFEAGCDDATFSAKGDLTFAVFDREASIMLDAVPSAMEAVESVEGLEVLRVDPDELVWASEIAQRTGRTRQSVDQLVKAQRGPGGFPAPATHATRNPLWRWSEVEEWFAAYEGREPYTGQSSVLAAINGALQARHGLQSAAKPVILRRALTKLLAS